MSRLVSPCPDCGHTRTALTANTNQTLWHCDLCGVSTEGEIA